MYVCMYVLHVNIIWYVCVCVCIVALCICVCVCKYISLCMCVFVFALVRKNGIVRAPEVKPLINQSINQSD